MQGSECQDRAKTEDAKSSSGPSNPRASRPKTKNSRVSELGPAGLTAWAHSRVCHVAGQSGSGEGGSAGVGVGKGIGIGMEVEPWRNFSSLVFRHERWRLILQVVSI